jgi:hypothetical protein
MCSSENFGPEPAGRWIILYAQISLGPLPSGHQGAIHDWQNND